MIEQKKLNELYFNQNVEELNLKINDYDHDSLKSKNEINDILILIKQKQILIIYLVNIADMAVMLIIRHINHQVTVIHLVIIVIYQLV